MIRLSSRRLILDKLGGTKLGSEVLKQTRQDMKQLEKKDNFIVRFLTRRRPIDYLAIEVDGPISKELDPSFAYAKTAFTVALCAPVFALVLFGYAQPTYYMLVSTGMITAAQYTEMWHFSHWAVVLGGQALCCLVLYDLSAYIRYPFFARVLAPFYRKMNYMRVSTGSSSAFTMEQLKSGAAHRRPAGVAARPLGRPLGEVKREVVKKDGGQHQQQNPFGKGAGRSK